MKNFTVSLLVFLVTFSGVCFGRDIYVATNGSDSNSGTISDPYLTISKAASVAVAGDVCYVRQGTYEETLTPANSGTSGNPIIFQSYPEEYVTISAMQPLSGWTPDAGSIYKTTVNWDLGQKNLVMDGLNALDLARWPNNTDGDLWTQNSLRNTSGSDGTVIYNAYLDYSPGIPNINWEDGGSIYFYGDSAGAGWLTWRRFIKSSTSTRVTFDLETGAGLEWIRTEHAPQDLGDFWLEGVKDALDYENEWYYDSATNLLYVQLPGGVAPSDGQISMRRRELAIDLGTKNYIEIRDLNVLGGSIEIGGSNNLLFGVTSLYGNWHRGIVTGFSVNSQSVYLAGSNNTVQNCEIGYGSGTGIWDDGTNNLVTNSYIHDFDYLGDYDAIVMARSWTGGNGTRLIGNTITRAGRDALQLVTNNCEIAYNDISACALIADDCGLFYNTGGPKNTEIHHNWFHDAYSSGTKTKVAGIYLDNDSEGFSVHHNVVWNTEWTSIQMNLDCKDIDVFNNTFWDGSAVMGAWHAAGTSFTNIRVWNNLGSDNNWEPQSDLQNNLTMSTDPFVDSANGDFRLNAGTTPIDYGRVISGITDGYVGAAPDAGAYEYGAADWVAGADLSLLSTPYNGSPSLIPGRIEAEEYNNGGQGVAYYDTTSGNSGGEFRTDDVDIESRDGGYTVGWVDDGEWLEYTVNATSGVYELKARVASTFTDCSFSVFLDGTQIAIVNVPKTQDWANFVDVTVPGVAVTGASDVFLRIEFSCPSGGQNLNWIEFIGETDPPTPDPATWASVPQADGSAISMIATTGSDASGVVEYYFEETSGNLGGDDSGWQSSPSYIDEGLDSQTEYTYRMRMQDATGNMTAWSGSQSATTGAFIEGAGSFLEQGGEVCFEAENYDVLEARSDSPNLWVEDTTFAGAVGSYMWTVDGQLLPEYPDYNYGARMLYDINFTTLGNYTVYVRRWVDANQQANAGSNSAWAGLDGVSTGVVDNTNDFDQWIWKSLGTVNVSTAGAKTLDIVRREDGYMVDRIVLTQGAIPTGSGPAESLRDFNATLVEFAIFASQWQRTDCSTSNGNCSGVDIDIDGDVDIDDLCLFAENWLNGM
ncbi:MAG: carbohydrate-binding protein [Planctomycetes bacterium]|nr:carbohydrate-binding protein [Planctomycetota bacterium]